VTAFRDIRRTDRAVSEDEAREILARADHGVLATLGPDGWPYAVPVNHVLSGDVLYIHCAVEGHKLENIAKEERVSFCAVADRRVLPARLTTQYESAIAFGRASLVTDHAEKRLALELLAVRFCGALSSEALNAIATSAARTAVIRIRLERITGKAHRGCRVQARDDPRTPPKQHEAAKALSASKER
jgi:nitroimidazol reductase NimA-like FMN-containing flavoprotein (pyridoxamine 5'-phosphate oxidase superfamily)